MILLVEENISFWAEYSHLMTDTAHIAFELSWEFITGIIVYPFAKKIWEKAVIKHDEEFHPDDKH